MLSQGTHHCEELVDLVKTYGLNDMVKLQLALPMGVANQFWNIQKSRTFQIDNHWKLGSRHITM